MICKFSKTLLAVIVSFLVLILVSSEAVAKTDSGKIKNKNLEERQEKILERLEEKFSSIGGILKNLTKRTAIINGTLTSKSGTTLTVTKDDKTYTVLTDSTTQLRRRFWGKATLDEMQIGDKLNVFGKWTNDTKTTIQARLVRDLSIQKRFGAFIGEVKSLTANGWVINTINRGDQTVTVSSTTRFVNRKEESITKNDILVGHRVRVKGLWDRANNTITEVTQVKDYSLPPRPTGVTKPTKTPTITPPPTLTPTPMP